MHAPAELEPGCWQATGHPLIIEFDPAVLNLIRSEAIDGLNRLSHGGLEVGGVLYGRERDHHITILSHRSLPCEYALGPSFTLSPNDERALEVLLAAPASDPELAGQQVVGWYHSHTRSDVVLSAKDVELFDRFFPEPWQIALVVCPHRLHPTRAGFFFREPDGSIHTQSSYREFLLKPQECVKTSAARPGIRNAAPRPDPIMPAAPPRAPQLLEETRIAISAPPAAKPARRTWTVLMTLAVAAVLIIAFSFFYPMHAETGALSLRVFDVAGQLRIDWDRDCASVRRAESAILEITDGGKTRRDALDNAQLRTGSVSYLRSSGDVVVRLQVISPERRVADETTRFLGPPAQAAGNMHAGSAERTRIEDSPASPPEKAAPKRTKKIPSFASGLLPQAPAVQAPETTAPGAPEFLDPPSTDTGSQAISPGRW